MRSALAWHAFFSALLLLVFAVVPPGAAAQQQRAGARIIVTEDADYFGFDYRTVKEVDLDACKAACLSDSACRAFTYNSKARWCFLKSDFGELKSAPGAIAGRVAAGEARRADAGKPAPLTFLPGSSAEDARRFAREIAAESPSPGISGQELARQARAAAGNPRAAVPLWRAALRLAPAEAATWNGLAAALLAIQTSDYSERYQLPGQAANAALNGYFVSTDLGARADALALLAAAFEPQQVFRPALEAYKLSLTLKDSAPVRAAYAKLREERGFRVIDYTVDADAASPRICVQFSESLPVKGTDFAKFVTLDGSAAPAVEPEDQQLCVEGVKHGERYAVGLRAGLPSTVDEVLESPVVLNVYVRDRSPAARFTGRNFVLPRTGPHGIPLVSVNTKEIEIELYRVGDRALAQAIVQGKFLSQLDRYGADDISDTFGQRLWKGTLEVEQVLNEEVTTSFPVDEALEERTPGVYVMVARPQGDRSQDWDARATQWFIVSDIGLASLSGNDGLHVFARSLSAAAPLSGVTVRLVARNNEVLGEAVTDAQGHAAFAAGLARGTGGLAPALVTAGGEGGDYAFLDLTDPAFDLGDRGVGGRPAPQPIDVFAYTERGIYRPGDAVHFVALARNEKAEAVADVPLTLIFSRPDGVEYRRLVSKDQGLGGHAADLVLPDTAMRGTWRVAVHADVKAPTLAEARFLVEDFVPDRIEFDLTSEATELPRAAAIAAQVEGRFLYGAPAEGLRLEGEISIRPAEGLAAYKGFSFGLADEELAPTREPLQDLPVTDGAGRARFDIRAASIPASTRPLEAVATLRMREGGGRAVERKLTLPVALAGPMVGVRPQFAEGRVEQGATATFEVIAVDAKGARTALSGLRWQLFKVQRSYQWYRLNGSWSFEPVDFSTRVADGRIDVAADRPAPVATKVDWGRYRLEIAGEGPDAPATSVEFSAGWYVEARAADTPDNLAVALDRKTYRPGETAKVTFEAAHDGAALVTVMSERLIAMQAVNVAKGRAEVSVPVTEDWGAGAYVTVSLYRPTGSEAARDPARALGLAWTATDMSARTLQVSFDVPETARPRTALQVPVQVAGLGAGDKAYLTLAAVDVGILNVTGYKPPEPSAWYYGQRKLGIEIRDLYGKLIDGGRGAMGRVRFGGDMAPVALAASPPREEPVVLFSGIVEADGQGRALASFDLPAFNGTLRLMAVAWSAGAVGQGTRDVVVRDPVVVTASLPRFLAPGDRSRLRLDIDNREGPGGAYRLAVSADDKVDVGAAEQAVELAAGQRRAVDVPLTARATGTGEIAVTLTGPDGSAFSRSLLLNVRPAQPPVTERRVVSLAPGGALSVTADLTADRVPGTGAVTLSVSRAGRLDIPSLLFALDRYPYGCAEQTTSRALPLLYLSEVAAASGLGDDAAIRERVQKAVYSVLAFQSASGSFGLWGPGEGDLWLDSYVADFLTRARERGFTVPEQAFAQLLDNLQNTLAFTTDIEGGEDIAYALYVLARNRRAAVGDLRYYVDTKLAEFVSPLAKAQLGAALGLYGEQSRSVTAFRESLAALTAEDADDPSRYDYGSRLRDGAAILTLASETGSAPLPVARLVDLVVKDYEAKRHTSTQEDAWLLLAARALIAGGTAPRLALNGADVSGDLLRRFASDALAVQPVKVENRGDQPLDAVLTVTGVPARPLPAGGDGFEIARTYYTMDGTPLDVSTVGQNERFVVVIEVTELNDWPSRVIVSDLLPAGFEIDNPALVDSADVAGLDWLPEKVAPARVEFRDDRFVAALDRTGSEPRSFTLAYTVRAVSPGRFVRAPALVEDMYRPYLAARTETATIEVIGARP